MALKPPSQFNYSHFLRKIEIKLDSHALLASYLFLLWWQGSSPSHLLLCCILQSFPFESLRNPQPSISFKVQGDIGALSINCPVLTFAAALLRPEVFRQLELESWMVEDMEPCTSTGSDSFRGENQLVAMKCIPTGSEWLTFRQRI